MSSVFGGEKWGISTMILLSGKFGGIDHQEKRLFYNLQPSIYNVNQILIQLVNLVGISIQSGETAYLRLRGEQDNNGESEILHNLLINMSRN